MKITGSSIRMAAKTSYTVYGSDGRVTEKTTEGASFEEQLQQGLGDSENLFAGYDRQGNLLSGGNGGVGGIRQSMLPAFSAETGLRNSLLRMIFGGFLQAGMSYGGLSATGASATGGSAAFTQIRQAEAEELSFRAAGRAMTEDGRSLSFDINLNLSRTFVEMTQLSVPSLAGVLMDPLVVNVGTAIAHVSDQFFRFDLDADGTEEDVAMIESGSGFLALDKNEDGMINDGSELFGAVSGDGFGDLRQYDDDGNGWIDENDAIFSKLRVWYRNGDGTDELVDLREADIGAIYLGEQATEFHLTGSGNRQNGMMRSTGMFFRESGGVGTIQHIDLMTRSKESREIGGENFVSGYGTVRKPVSDVLVVPGRIVDRKTRQETDDTEEKDSMSEAERRTKQAEERERLKEDAKRRKEEKKRRNEELIKKAQERREEEEERVEELFADRKQRREDAMEYTEKRREDHEKSLTA